MTRRNREDVGALMLARAALRSLPENVQRAVASAEKNAPEFVRRDLISIAWLYSRTCDDTEHLCEMLRSETRRMWSRRVETRSTLDDERTDDICGSFNNYCAESPLLEGRVETRDPEWYLLASEANPYNGLGMDDAASICAGELSESILHAPSLARRMGISVRHARRYIKRWRQQDDIWGDD